MSTTSSVKSNSPIDSPILYSQWWLARRSRRLAEELVISHVGGGWMRVPCSVNIYVYTTSAIYLFVYLFIFIYISI